MQLVISLRRAGVNHKAVCPWVVWDRSRCSVHCQNPESVEGFTVKALLIEPHENVTECLGWNLCPAL